MKIAMVSVHSNPLGKGVDPLGAHVAGLAAALAGLGHEVAVYSRRADPELPDRVRTDRGFDVVQVAAGPAESLADAEVLAHLGDFTSSLTREWGVTPPDVVHGHGWMSGLVSVLGARRAGAPVVQTFHSLATPGRRCATGGPAERGKIEVLVGREVAHVVAAGSDEAFALAGKGVNRKKISIVGSGVDIDAFTPEGPRARRDRMYRVVVASPPPAARGIDGVLIALSRVDCAELLITGLPDGTRPDGEREVAELRARAEKFGVASRTTFVGKVPHESMPALLRSADAVVCAPAGEPSGGIAVEAMACGVPVVATATGEFADIVVDGITGLLVPPDDTESQARALRRLLMDDTLRQECAIAGRDRVSARYSWDHVAQEVLRAYERAGATSQVTTAVSPDPAR
ncbi:glycosyltransferase [Lentzea jiangxiensis]|uniref:Glycosyltransferase involved in cell wall bisynthesis n=1 Tax=Lentzea jiangxiensis TaxID=641025 RepID=A0A1H0LNB5_9PSEU|nr:glycosyltransferase [Lentzea jiangxiensis]SDO69739.1 Glycosyltransferase involved in cell wall bisynthesis [Lentzea jiangxiensis]